MTTRNFSNGGKRYNGKCKCGAKFSALVVSETFGEIAGPVSRHRGTEFHTERFDYAEYCYGLVYVCKCGATRIAKPVQGKFVADKKCNALCQSAAGHSCECACGGKNHGASHG